MRERGWMIGVAALAALTLLALVVVLTATPAEATVTGVQVPSYGNDWIIDQDTTVLGETIKLQGEILIDPGVTMSVRNSQITFNSSFPGEHGIWVGSNSSAGDGALSLDDCSVRSDYEGMGWYFDVDGKLTIDNNVRLYHVQDGIWIYSTADVDINDMELYAQGSYGIYVMNADPRIHNSEIYLTVPANSFGTAIRLSGSSSDRVVPDFDGLTVRVQSSETYETTSSSYSTTFDLMGLDASYATLDPLKNIDISFEVKVDGQIDYSSPRMYVYLYVTGYYFSSGTQLVSMSNVQMSQSDFFVDADSSSAASGYLYIRSYIYGLENRISSSGSSPNTFSGFSMTGQKVDYNGNNIYNNVYNYPYGRAFVWYPSTAAMTASTVTVDGIVIDDIEIYYMLEITNSLDMVIQNCEFKNSYIYYYFHYMSNYQVSVKYDSNLFYNNTADRNPFFRVYYPYDDFEFVDNTFEKNTYYQVFYIYYNRAKIFITGNTFWNNTERQGGASYFLYSYYNYATFTMERNHYIGNQFNYFAHTYYTYESFYVKENVFENNSARSWGFYSYYIYSDMVLEDNVLYNNSFSQGFFWDYYHSVKIIFDDNYMEGNSFGTGGFLWLYGYVYGDMEITDNEFVNNSAAGKMFELYGIGKVSSNRGFVFERNTFIGNSASTSTTGGLVFFYKISQSISVRDNYFENNSANCIVFNTPYYYGYQNQPVYNWFFSVEGNEFFNNSGKCIYFYQIDNCNIVVRGNKAIGNKDYALFLDVLDNKQYIYTDSNHYNIYCYYNAQGPDTLTVEANNFSYNRGGGMWLRTSQTDNSPSGTYYPYGNPDQIVSIKKNLLYGNGPDGWALGLSGLYRKPILRTNPITGSSMGMYWELITDNRRVEFDLEYRNEYVDGGPDGMTAYGFKEIDVEFYDCTFVNFKKALYAEDCLVQVYWCSIPESSGETAGKGRIYVWNHLEILVTWANKTGVDSGIPVKNAVVAMQGANGQYFGAMLTDTEGRLGPLLINPWVCVDGNMDAWSPFKTTILALNATTAHEMHVVGEYVDPDPLELTLWDIFEPEVIISNPQDGTLVDTADVLTEGFLFERGSGIKAFEGRTDMMEEDEWVDITQSVLWTQVHEDMSEGNHTLMVRAGDRSGNWNTSVVDIIVDLTKPNLDVWLEYLNATRIPFDEVKGGYYVHDREIAINGTYSDNFADDRDIMIRINGEPEHIFVTQLGKVYKRIRLEQGINTLIIDATDTAGNRREIKHYVSLDSYAPTMYIYSPLQGEKTANETIFVTGLTEPLTRLEFRVQASAGTNIYKAMSQEDGNFEYPVDLFEGIQKILVTATDSAGNPTQLFRDVTLDTTPPDFIINDPEVVTSLWSEVRFTIVGTMTREPDAEVYIWGQRVEHTGVFTRTVVLQEGENAIDILAIDKVGNEKVKYVTIIRDTVAPIMELTAPEGDVLITSDPTVTFAGTVAGADGVVIVHKSIPLQATLVEGDWQAGGKWTYDLELGPSDLENDIEVKAYDLAGNEMVEKIYIQLDVVPPSLNVFEVPEEVTTPLLWINGTTDTSILTVLVQSVDYSVVDGEFAIQWSLAAGDNAIRVSVTDEAGNEAEETVNVFYKYTPPPKPEGPEEESVWQNALLGALVIAAITIVVAAVVFTYQWTRRR